MRHSTKRIAILLTVLLFSCFQYASAQSSAARAKNLYVNPGALPAGIRSALLAFGDRLHRPGNERITALARYTDSFGTTDVSLIWEVPGRVRLEKSDKQGRPLIYDEDRGWNSAAITPQEADVLESLFDDTSESFFYSITNGTAYRFLGNRFRTDDGKTKNYVGPWYDIYEVFPSIRSPQAESKKRKLYYFDSQTGRLSRVDYVKNRSLQVSTEMSDWRILNGQSHPGKVVRKENGVVTLTVTLTNFSVGPAVSDGVFPGR